MGIVDIDLPETFLPYDTSVINGLENIKPFVSGFVDELHWPAASIPAINHKLVNGLVDLAILTNHVIELIHYVGGRESVVKNVSEWILSQGVNQLISLFDIVVAEAAVREGDVFVLVHASLGSLQEVVDQQESKLGLFHIN